MKTNTLFSVFCHDHQTGLLRAACRLFYMDFLTFAAAHVASSLPYFRTSRTELNLVCQARLAKGKTNYE